MPTTEGTMMPLIDRLKDLENTPPVNNCPVARVVKELDAETIQVLQRLLDSKIATRVIHDALRNEGMRIARESIANHRKGWCQCGGAE